MTRKHFEAIAHTLNANVTALPVVLDMADTLEETNPRFDRERFVAASTILLREAAEREIRMIDKAAGRV